jgi:hypothetical protein
MQRRRVFKRAFGWPWLVGGQRSISASFTGLRICSPVLQRRAAYRLVDSQIRHIPAALFTEFYRSSGYGWGGESRRC